MAEIEEEFLGCYRAKLADDRQRRGWPLSAQTGSSRSRCRASAQRR